MLGLIIERGRSAYAVAWAGLLEARSKAKLSGDAAEVNEMTAQLKKSVSEFRKAGLASSPEYKDKLKALRKQAKTLWIEAHEENNLVHTSARERLMGIPAPAVVELLQHYVHACSNTEFNHEFVLSERFPQYFGAEARSDLLSVRTRFEGSGGGEGSLNLSPGIGEHLVSDGGLVGKKWNGNKLLYKHDTTVLRVWLGGGGWGGGVCSNPITMKHVEFTISQKALALPENAKFNLPYQRGVDPVFK